MRPIHILTILCTLVPPIAAGIAFAIFERATVTALAVATSANGITDWKVDPERGLLPEFDSYEEEFGVEDPRISQVGDEYYVVYTGFSADGPLVCIARTRDFSTWERLGVAMRPDDKDAALFPVKFGDQSGQQSGEQSGKRWAMLHRPGTGRGSHTWLSFSPDLKHWGDPRVVLSARKNGWWDNHKVGLGPPSLLTRDGWLMCYHGVRSTAAGSIYRAGIALLDKDDPARVLARGDEWLLSPREPYERQGDVGHVVFPCGWILRDDGDTEMNAVETQAGTSLIGEQSIGTYDANLVAKHTCLVQATQNAPN